MQYMKLVLKQRKHFLIDISSYTYTIYVLNVSEPKVRLHVGNCTALNASCLLIKGAGKRAIDRNHLQKG